MTRLLLAALLLTGCIDTSVEATTVALSVAGTAPTPFEDRSGSVITLERAELAFGPLYLCPGRQAGELCEEALAEYTDAVVVDALDPARREIGEMSALTGTARSYMYDLGIVSLLGRDAPLVTEAAASLDGASAVVSGRADVNGQTIPFTIAIAVAQSASVEGGVPVVRSSATEGFELLLRPDGASTLTVRFDPRDWLSSASFDSLVEDAACSVGAEVVCAGSVEQRCAADGGVAEMRDCADFDQACVRGVGCVDSVALDADDAVGRALSIGLTSGARPDFETAR